MQSFALLGAIVNALTVAAGACVGLLIKKLLRSGTGAEKGEALSDCVFKGVGLCVLAIGITGTIKAAVNGQILSAMTDASAGGAAVTLSPELTGERTLVLILSMALGALIGQLLDLEKWVNRLGELIENAAKSKFGNVAQGFVSASLLFCVGSMTVVGSLNSGLVGDHTVLFSKSTLDLISATVLASTLGVGVLFSALFVLVFEGSITLLAGLLEPVLSGAVISMMSVVGSLLIIGLALNMLGVTKLKIMNYMPAIFLPILLIPLGDLLGGVI